MGVVLLKRKLTSFQIIILGFSGVILFGTFLLMLPFSSRSGLATPFSEALFTSTSAVCVTGLIIHDTATYWSAFGQFVILLLIQIGGMGVITVAASFAMISGRKISLMQRSTMQEAISAPKVGGIVRLTGFIVRVTLVMELLCAAVMAPVFCRDFGKIGLWMALFHSVSAFCNAGFDLLGVRTPFSSLTSYAANPVINFTIMFLIVFGGIGFLTWDDIRTNRLHLRKYRMQSKVILCTTAVLLIVPAMYFYFFEFADLTRKERLLSSLFQAVTPRTAGFNTVELTDLSEAGQFITIALMLIGGSPGSTAGGLKTTTIAVLLTTAISTFRRRENANLFGRRIHDGIFIFVGLLVGTEIHRMPHILRLGQNLPDDVAAPVIGVGELLFAFPDAFVLLAEVDRRRIDLIVKQDTGNIIRAFALDGQLKDAAHHGSRFLVDQPVVFVFRVFPVAIDSAVGGGLAGFPFDANGRFLLAAQIAKIPLIHDIEEGGKLVAVLIVAVHAVGDSHKVDTVLPEENLRVKAGLQVITTRPTHVLDNDMGHLSGLNVRHQPLPCGPLKIAAAPAVIRIVPTVGVASLLGIAFEVFFLIDDGVAVASIVIVTAQPLIESCNSAFSLFHAHDALLSDCRLICGVSIIL